MKDCAGKTDGEWLAAYVAHGDEKAFEQLYRKYADMVFTVCLRHLKIPQDAEDAAAACFIVLHRKAHTVQDEKLGTWLYGCALRAAWNEATVRRRRARREEKGAAMERMLKQENAEPEPCEMLPAVDRAIDRLPRHQRDVVILHFYRGLSLADMARMLGCPEGTVASRLGRAIGKLRKALTRNGTEISEPALVSGLSGAGLLLPAPTRLWTRVLGYVQGNSVSDTVEEVARMTMRNAMWTTVRRRVSITGGVALMGLGTLALAQKGTDGTETASADGSEDRTVSYEHYAWAVQMGHLDGPRREAMGHRTGPVDEDFNVYVGWRSIRAEDERAVTYGGNDYWPLDFGLDEGPTAYLPRTGPILGTGYGQGVGGRIVRGRPWKGEQHGCVYSFSDSDIWRIWRNDSQDGRWWFKRIAGPGLLAIPGERIYQGQATREGAPVFFTKTGFYRYDETEDGGAWTCLLALDAIKDQFPVNDKSKRPAWPTLGVMDTGGFFYLGFYFSSFGSKTVPGVMRVTADSLQAEPYATPPGMKIKFGTDGAGMKSGWHCGPHFHPPKAVSPWYPPGVLILHAHDESNLRRIMNGRVSTLCTDGQWRENDGKTKHASNHILGADSFVYGPGGCGLIGGSRLASFGGRRRGTLLGEGIYLLQGLDMGAEPVVRHNN